MFACLELRDLDLMPNKFLYRFSKKPKCKQVANLIALPPPILRETAKDRGMEKVRNAEKAWAIHSPQTGLLNN